MKIKRIVCGAYDENAYLVNDSVLIDPGDGLGALTKQCKKLSAILLTHGHFDHTIACAPLQKAFGAKVYIDMNDAPMLTDQALSAYDPAACSLELPSELDFCELGSEAFGLKVLRTPGHSKGSVCFYSEDEGILFSGDTLFKAGFGRMDLTGGSAIDMRRSLFELFKLPDDVTVYPGHGDSTTIGAEKRRYHR